MIVVLLAAAFHFAPSSQGLAPPNLPRHATFGAAFGQSQKGAAIQRIIPGGAAAAAGLAAGDVIVRLADAPIENTGAFLAQIHRFHAGQSVAVEFLRNGVRRTASVTLGTPPSERDPNVETVYGSVVVDGTLRRTLTTIPKSGAGRLPAMLVLGGIGCYSVDAASNPEDPYLRLAHDVTAKGFIVMRIEKSGVGDSEGPPCFGVDFDAERRGYAAALEALRADSRVDPKRVYLFGHSIGTLQAALLANASPVAGIIVAEAVGRDWPEYEIRNLRRQLELNGEQPPAVDAALIEKTECLTRLLLENQAEAQIERSNPECKEPNGVYPVDAPYMREVARVNVAAQWATVSVPVLAIYGTSDFVTERADHERIVGIVNARHPGSAVYDEIAGMDHLLYTAATPKAAMDAFSAAAPRAYDSALSRAVADWLCAREKCA